MNYECVIQDVVDDEVTIKIRDTIIVCYANCGCEKNVGDICNVTIDIYDDIQICESNNERFEIIRQGNSLSYYICGVLDVENHMIRSLIDFDIDDNMLMYIGYLDNKYVRVNVVRLDIEFT